jgi:uncharacterized membrane-anchored protein YhcB (DUF1043 family)
LSNKALLQQPPLATLKVCNNTKVWENTLTTLSVILILAAFLIGAGIGHLLSKKVDSSDKSVRNLEQKLAASEKELKRYQQEVTEHFITASHLTGNIAQSYRQIHEHLASNAMRLASPDVARQILKSGGSDFGLLDSNGNPLIDLSDVEVPRDYAPSVPGGILSEDYGLTESEQSKAENDAEPELLDSDSEDEKDPTQSVA